VNGQNEVTLTADEALSLAAAALVANRTSPEIAASVADALVAAEIDGQAGHGLARVPSYAAQSRSGKVDGYASPVFTRPAPAVIRVDAAHGFAYPAFDRLAAELPELARANGIAIATVHRSHHFGQAGRHAERLADRGLAAFAFTNSPGAIAPWGGRRGLYGTNPIAFAAPRRNDPPLVIDLALSIGARGKIMAAQRTGEPIPEGWALDTDGNPTTDPFAALPGTMLPIGGAKGAALALMVEVLTAALAGAGHAHEQSSLFSGDGAPLALGQTLIAIDVGPSSGGLFAARLETLLGEIAAEPGARLPGTRRLENRARAASEGLAVAGDLYQEITELAGLAEGRAHSGKVGTTFPPGMRDKTMR
jgi:(2R)-3-sulfolactate dehydrogenase (NADP+)